MRKKDGFKSEKLFVLPDYMQKEFRQHELIKELMVTDIGYFPKAAFHYRDRPDGADSYLFIYCSDGEGWVELNGQNKLTVQKHMLTVIPADVPHRYGAADHDPWSIYWFHLTGEQVAVFIKQFELDNSVLRFPSHFFGTFVELFERCYNLLTMKAYSSLHHIHLSQTMRYLLSTIGLHVIRSQQDEKREHYLDNAINYMHEHLDGMLQLDDIARHIGLSKQHVIYIFKKETGTPPIDYFIKMKIQHACQLLDLTEWSLKEISHSLGMKDPYYFSRLFKKVIGMSPTAYRQQQKG
ncbi:AraC family transcriptional regulator [Gracilibacillus salinarum]|uniref:AraC family transcriptional regulator n=1 Tax=Gracilibacillus salinarum TaxID=2932255 RepID=A0ABY4GS18_9BACI|nr:AraC family transcriptional regulator [Gracilibacillus salinarum]UOQ87160.1 AraC family transcriptional regulator [Gracilibacillus salinarum]